MGEILQREEQIFCDAIEISDNQERAEFIREQCGNDQSLFRRIQQLIRMHQTEGKILDGTTYESSAANAETVSIPREGDSIGNYKLLQEIGEGGMGVVFMAEQAKPVRRKVAVKIIKVGMDTRRVVARFESERQALALMDHPCITKVLDAGSTESGRPYFVMELVRGKTITQFCDEKKLSVRDRLRVFEQICQAVEHAHQKGIIHRDLKPTNIMVTSNDGQPLPKIIDFGIAKATGDRLTDKTLFTNYGEMIGTPLYMSPEQAEMTESDVDTRSDIYSLGVLLYELLTGTTPFADLKKKSFHAIRDAIRSRDPQIASTRVMSLGDTLEKAAEDRGTDSRSLHRFIKGDIDWILVKCLSRKRENRYQSAGELAREIRRHLDGEPVEAAAPTVSYRVRKFVSRHKAPVLIAASLGMILLGSTVISSYLAIRANDLARQAKLNEKRAIKAEKELANQIQLVKEDRDKKAELARRWGIELGEAEAAAIYNELQYRRLFERQQKKSTPASFTEYIFRPRSKKNERPLRTRIENVRNIARGHSMYRTSQKPAVNAQPKQQTLNVMERASEKNDAKPLGLKSMKIQQEMVNNVANLNIVILDDEERSKAEYLQNLWIAHKKLFGDKDPIVVKVMAQYGECLTNQKQWEESEKILEKTLELMTCKENKGKDLPVGPVRLNLAKTYSVQGKDKHAQQQILMWKKENRLRERDIPKRVKDTLNAIDSQMQKLRNQKNQLKRLENKLRNSKKSDQE